MSNYSNKRILRVAVLDDEQAFCDEISRLLVKWAEETMTPVQVRAYTESRSFLDDFRSHPFDVLLLDVCLNDPMNGLEVAEQLRNEGFDTPIIFLTNRREQVFDAFGVGPVNYLLKPVKYASIDQSMTKAAGMAASRPARIYLLQQGSARIPIPVADILYCESHYHRTKFHLFDSVSEEWKSLAKVENDLPHQFVRCSKSAVVNLMQIKQFNAIRIELLNGDVVRIGAKYQDSFQQRWMEFFA